MIDFDQYLRPGADRPRFNRTHHGQRYLLGRRVLQRVCSAYEPTRLEPQARRVRIFAIDPAASKLEGKTAITEVPYEPLEPGPCGRLIAVDNEDGETGSGYAPADLDDRGVLLSNGYAPSESDPRFHAQMVYAVASLVHASFRRALGRQVGWPFGSSSQPPRLRIRPFAAKRQNAWYDPNDGTLNFGYYYAGEEPTDRTLPRGVVFTSLSHDIVAHEMSHAMLDALRANFSLFTSTDMAGFHEGFADLVALFHHFQYADPLRKAIASCRGEVGRAEYLRSIGQQFGRSSGEAPLRSAADTLRYDAGHGAHRMGALLMAAMFEAYVVVFERKTAPLRRLASGGTGRLPEGDLPDLLVDALAKKAGELAEQFLGMLIRAVDFLPPVDVRLGEFLRAIITADSDLVQEDRWGYREAVIDAFRKRGIYPRDVASLNEDSLLWRPPLRDLPPIEPLSFKEIWFDGDPGTPVTVGEQIAQACELGEYVTQSVERMEEFGLVAGGDPRLEGDEVSLPTIESVRTLRRPGPDGRVVFDTVAEILQRREIRPRNGRPGLPLHGGCTAVLDSNGRARSVILKRAVAEGRVERRLEFLSSGNGARFWKLRRDRYEYDQRTPFLALCESTG